MKKWGSLSVPMQISLGLNSLELTTYALHLVAAAIHDSMSEELLCGHWRLQDIVAHLIGWNIVTVEMLEHIKVGKYFTHWISDEHLDQFNASSVAQRRNIAWTALLEEFIGTSRKLARAYRELAPHLWMEPVVEGKFSSLESLWEDVAHFKKHLQQLYDAIKFGKSALDYTVQVELLQYLVTRLTQMPKLYHGIAVGNWDERHLALVERYIWLTVCNNQYVDALNNLLVGTSVTNWAMTDHAVDSMRRGLIAGIGDASWHEVRADFVASTQGLLNMYQSLGSKVANLQFGPANDLDVLFSLRVLVQYYLTNLSLLEARRWTPK